MRAVFLDLNGTLVMPVQVSHPTEYTLLPHVGNAIRLLNQHQYCCPIITVQSRIAKHLYTMADFQTWFATLQQHLSAHDAHIVGPYVCPHRRRDACACAKPLPYLYEQAAQAYGITLQESFVVGDTLDDVGAAQRLGCQGLLVQTGWGSRSLAAVAALGAPIVADIAAAAEWIVRHPRNASTCGAEGIPGE